MKSLPKLQYAGGVDADGHIMEPPDLWERYMEPRYRDRAMRIRCDDNGLEYLEFDGRMSKIVRNGMPSGVGAMDRMGGIVYEREPTGVPYVDNAPLGAMDPTERIQRLDLENLDRVLLYPTLGVLWPAECDDEEIAQAYLRAYNRWIVDFCSDSGGRLVPIAQLSLGDPEAAEQELRRAVADGVKGVWVPPFQITRKRTSHPDHHGVFAAAQELDIPLGIHPSFEPLWAAPGRFDEMSGAKNTFFINMTAGDGIKHAFTALVQDGIFDLFPELRVVLLECGASWISHWLDRMDALYASPQGRSVPLKEKPSYYFRRQCWISADPDETLLSSLIPHVGSDRFFWASDFPHPDHPPDYIEHMNELIANLPEADREGLLGRNVLEAYRLDP